MRHISFDTPPDDKEWLAKANQLLEKLKEASTTEERKAIIDSNSKVWGDLKEWLLDLSHQKCWFSESKDCFSYWDVEHYRPKKSAKDLDGTTHEGYWWLAFAWQNLRVCGNVGNRKKGTFFPLREGSKRVTEPEPKGELRDEDPFLLDPTDPDDPNLLSFNLEGRAILNPNVKDEWAQLRVTYSVERYNLDFPPLMSKRQLIWHTCWQYGEQYLAELIKYQENPNNMIAKVAFKEKAKNIRQMLKADQECSSVARAYLLSAADPRLLGLLQSS